MTTRQFKPRTNSDQRTAFTLVELMIVIVIIGILAAIATPVVNAALRRSKEFTIENEVQQLSAAVDKFEIDHGFLPPTFNVPGGGLNSQAEFLRYLNKIAPNHNETSTGGLAKWWDQVGSNLDERSSLVFWLSGLCTSKQYPLSGTAAIATSGPALAPYDASKFVDDSDVGGPNLITRQVFYEFRTAQLVNANSGNSSGGSTGSSSSVPDGIKVYNQAHGKSGGDLAYHYRDFSSYIGTVVTAYRLGPGNNRANYLNPTTFQIVGPGLDGVYAENTVRDLRNSTRVDPTQDDNITNFSGGRLERSYDE